MSFNKFLITLGAVLIIIVTLLTVTFATEKTSDRRHWYSSTYQFIDGHMLYKDITNVTCLGTGTTETKTLLFKDGDTIYMTDELMLDEPCLSTYYVKDDGKMITIARAQETGVLSTESLLEHNFKIEVETAYNFTPLSHHVESFRPFTIDGANIDLGQKYESGDAYFTTISTHIMSRPFYDETVDSSTFVDSLRVSFSNGDIRTFELYSDYIIDEETGYVAYFDEKLKK